MLKVEIVVTDEETDLVLRKIRTARVRTNLTDKQVEEVCLNCAHYENLEIAVHDAIHNHRVLSEAP